MYTPNHAVLNTPSKGGTPQTSGTWYCENFGVIHPTICMVICGNPHTIQSRIKAQRPCRWSPANDYVVRMRDGGVSDTQNVRSRTLEIVYYTLRLSNALVSGALLRNLLL